jgi:hypothetical protein
MSHAKYSEAGSIDDSFAYLDIPRFTIVFATFNTVGTISARSAVPLSGLRFATMRGAGT